MFIARLEDGASILEEGAPDLHKFSRSIIIPDDKQMEFKILKSDYIDYENIYYDCELIVQWNNPYFFALPYLYLYDDTYTLLKTSLLYKKR